MKDKICEFEKAVVKEFRQKIRSEKLVLHVKECANCQETLKVANWMQNFASSSAPKHSLPTPGFLLWKSKIIEKQKDGKRAAQPIEWTQTAAVILAVIPTVWLLIKYQSKLAPVIENFSASLQLVAAPLIIAFVSATVVCLAVALKWRESSRKT